MGQKSLIIESSQLSGKLKGTPSKSQAIRSIIFSTLAQGESSIRNLPESPDIQKTLDFCEQLGAKISGDSCETLVQGVGAKFKAPQKEIDVGNSGLLLRLGAPLLALLDKPTRISGDSSIVNLRPTTPLVQALKQMGATIQSDTENDRPPLKIKGPISASSIEINGEDSQPVSALLIISTLLSGTTELKVKSAGEKPWIDLTLHWLHRLGAKVERQGYEKYTIYGNHIYHPIDYLVPSDFSSLGFMIAAAMITRSEIVVSGFDFSEEMGDLGVLNLLQQLGAVLEISKKRGIVSVRKTDKIQGGVVDINVSIDSLPLIAALGCYADRPLKIINGKIARLKESDRIEAMASELRKMGAKLEVNEDGLLIYPSKLIGARLSSYQDHRIAMALSIAALGAKGQTLITDADCVEKSYPKFFKDLASLGAKVKGVL